MVLHPAGSITIKINIWIHRVSEVMETIILTCLSTISNHKHSNPSCWTSKTSEEIIFIQRITQRINPKGTVSIMIATLWVGVLKVQALICRQCIVAKVNQEEVKAEPAQESVTYQQMLWIIITNKDLTQELSSSRIVPIMAKTHIIRHRWQFKKMTSCIDRLNPWMLNHRATQIQECREICRLVPPDTRHIDR